jgi:hypothetical protein
MFLKAIITRKEGHVINPRKEMQRILVGIRPIVIIGHPLEK